MALSAMFLELFLAMMCFSSVDHRKLPVHSNYHAPNGLQILRRLLFSGAAKFGRALIVQTVLDGLSKSQNPQAFAITRSSMTSILYAPKRSNSAPA